MHRQRDVEIDPETLSACQRGDRRAQEVVFRAYAPELGALLSRLSGPRGDAEDLLQSTLLAATRAFSQFRGEASVRTWLYRIAVRVFQQQLRQDRRRRHLSLEVVPAEDQADGRPTPERQCDTRRRMHRLYHHLEALSPARRVPFVLHVLEGRPVDEVAQLVGCSALAARSRIFWARRQLMKRLRKDPWFAGLTLDDKERSP